MGDEQDRTKGNEEKGDSSNTHSNADLSDHIVARIRAIGRRSNVVANTRVASEISIEGEGSNGGSPILRGRSSAAHLSGVLFAWLRQVGDKLSEGVLSVSQVVSVN